MASPFSIFRKNQKVMIAVLGVLAMFAFVFIPIIMEGMGSRTIRNPVVVKTSQFGNLHEYNIRNLQSERHRVLGVLNEVMQIAGTPPALAKQWLEARIGTASEESVVNSWLVARYAGQMGMVVTDQTINSFLKDLTQNAVKPASFQMAFKRSGLSEFQFFNAMRDVLAAMQLESMFRVSLLGITPAERWEYFARVKQMAAIEALPVPVANYVSRVEDPKDEELKAFFEENKERYSLPDSPQPGFHEPQKIALEYFKAEVEKLAASVTDEEIKQRYEKNKDLYEEKKPEEKKEEKASTKDTKDTKEPKGQEAAGKEVPKDAKEKKETKPTEKKKDSKGSSAVGRKSPFMLTAMVQEEKSGEKAKTPEAKPAEKKEEKASTKDTKDTKKPEPAKSESKPADQKKVSPWHENVEKPKPGMAEATKIRIRREIAYEKLQKIFAKLREQMEDYNTKYQKYTAERIQREAGKKKQSIGPPPPSPDFEKLAKEYGLSAGRTPLISQWEARGSEIGASLVGGREPVWFYAYQSGAKFKPEMSADLKGDVFLFWKTDETKDRVPKFDDKGVRERVLHEWKMIRARKLALAAAQTLASEASKADKSLKKAFADRPDMRVILPPPFSWMTFGNVPLGSAPNAVRRSVVTGVEEAGDEFMRTVFHLTPGQIGVAMNAPQTVAYVVQLTEFTPSYNVLWKQFEVDDFNKYTPVAAGDQQQVVRAWLDEIKKSSGVQWMRKSDQTTESVPSGEE
jgi:hypothetical protein